MRQQGGAQADFRATLMNVAEGRPNIDDFLLLKTRMKSCVSEQEQALFRDAVHPFPTNDFADGEKTERLRRLGSPKALIRASYYVSAFSNISPDRFRGLEPKLTLAVGAVFL